MYVLRVYFIRFVGFMYINVTFRRPDLEVRPVNSEVIVADKTEV